MPGTAPIDDCEWDFTQVPDDRIRGAFIWEFSRTQEWLRKAAKRRNRKALPPPPMTPSSVVPLGETVVRRRRAEKQETARWKLKNDRIIEIWTSRDFDSRGVTGFISQNLHLVFTDGFPDCPFQSAVNASAIIERYDAMPLDAVYEMNPNVVTVKGRPNPLISAAQGSWLAGKMQSFVTEENGGTVNFDPGMWRKFTLAIDWHRTDEEILDSFRHFVKAARTKHGLKELRKHKRASRGGIPTWLTKRQASDSLRALSAHRLIEAFDGNVHLARRHAKTKRPLGFELDTVKEFKRAANRVPEIVAQLFGSSVRAS